ncbi:glycosyltransferase [Secundilactobacillus paracollinoides]|uniref:glycosyltransferase n=1 Tax=Secundilactobacillus paracollinoides TaxID=240427 RepID=UPI003F45F0CA
MSEVFIITPFLSGKGGTETIIKNIFKSIRPENKYSFKLFVLGGTETKDWLQESDFCIKNLLLPKKFKKIEYLFRLPYWIFQIAIKNPKIIISTSPIIWSMFYWLKKILNLGYKVVGWYHFSISEKPFSKFEANSQDAFFSISSGITAEMKEKVNNKIKIFTIFNPIPVNGDISFPTPHKKTNKLELVYIGRFDYDKQKNLSELFTALSKINEAFELKIFGEGEDKAKLSRYANSIGISACIKWMGFQTDIWKLIKKTDALILTSKYEGLPTVLIEALAHGIPVISSNCSTGPEDIVVDKYNGYLYKLGSVNELVKKISEIGDIELINEPYELQKTAMKFSPQNYLLRMIQALDSLDRGTSVDE